VDEGQVLTMRSALERAEQEPPVIEVALSEDELDDDAGARRSGIHD
jgi:hypothetical protein